MSVRPVYPFFIVVAILGTFLTCINAEPQKHYAPKYRSPPFLAPQPYKGFAFVSSPYVSYYWQHSPFAKTTQQTKQQPLVPFVSFKRPELRNRKEPLSKLIKTPATTVKIPNSPLIASQNFVTRSKLKARKPVKITGIKTTTVPLAKPVKTTLIKQTAVKTTVPTTTRPKTIVKQSTVKPTAAALTTTTVPKTTVKQTTTTTVPTTTEKQTTAKTTTVPTTTVKQTTAKTTTTTRRPTTTFKETTAKTTTTRSTATMNTMVNSVEEDEVLDFSSGSPKVVKNSATKPEKNTSKGPPKAFSIFRDLIDLVNITQELEAAGNVTIFAPLNPGFEKLPSKIEDVSTATLRRWILKHFIKGSLFRKDMKNGPIQTLGGDFVTIVKDEETNKVKVFSASGESKVKISNIKLKFGLVHVVDTVIT